MCVTASWRAPRKSFAALSNILILFLVNFLGSSFDGWLAVTTTYFVLFFASLVSTKYVIFPDFTVLLKVSADPSSAFACFNAPTKSAAELLNTLMLLLVNFLGSSREG